MTSGRRLGGSFRRGAAISVAVAALLAGRASSLRGQGGLLVQGIADGEFWSTDTLSNLLTRHGGSPSGVGRLVLWSAIEPWERVVLFAQGEFEGGAIGVGNNQTRTTLEQAGLRFAASPAFVVDIGKMPGLVGTFASRRFSTRNPLISEPDGYPVQYPVGAAVSGSSGPFDYRAGLLSLPVTHQGYTPTPSPAFRPAAGFGFTPTVGVRIGGSFTQGPYLNRNLPASDFAGASWRQYQERILAADGSFTRGYFEAHAEYARGSYEVPAHAGIVGETYYIELKYTLTPRLFVAVRGERNEYPFIAAVNATTWVTRPSDFHDGEAGIGYRLSASTLLKASYRADKRYLTPANQNFSRPGGHAFAVQLSQAFDVMDWLQPPQ